VSLRWSSETVRAKKMCGCDVCVWLAGWCGLKRIQPTTIRVWYGSRVRLVLGWNIYWKYGFYRFLKNKQTISTHSLSTLLSLMPYPFETSSTGARRHCRPVGTRTPPTYPPTLITCLPLVVSPHWPALTRVGLHQRRPTPPPAYCASHRQSPAGLPSDADMFSSKYNPRALLVLSSNRWRSVLVIV
jgi:hypothetical protein